MKNESTNMNYWTRKRLAEACAEAGKKELAELVLSKSTPLDAARRALVYSRIEYTGDEKLAKKLYDEANTLNHMRLDEVIFDEETGGLTQHGEHRTPHEIDGDLWYNRWYSIKWADAVRLAKKTVDETHEAYRATMDALHRERTRKKTIYHLCTHGIGVSKLERCIEEVARAAGTARLRRAKGRIYGRIYTHDTAGSGRHTRYAASVSIEEDGWCELKETASGATWIYCYDGKGKNATLKKRVRFDAGHFSHFAPCTPPKRTK